MDVICMYCKAPIHTIETALPGVSHGVCQNCIPRLVEGLSQPLSEYLDKFSTPIMYVGGDLRVVAGNQAARKLSPEPLNEICCHLCGEVIGCKHSREPEGCGQTVHCPSCAIRRSVLHTNETGEPCRDVPAYQDIGLMGDKRVCFQISTEKISAFVRLRIKPTEETSKG